MQLRDEHEQYERELNAGREALVEFEQRAEHYGECGDREYIVDEYERRTVVDVVRVPIVVQVGELRDHEHDDAEAEYYVDGKEPAGMLVEFALVREQILEIEVHPQDYRQDEQIVEELRGAHEIPHVRRRDVFPEIVEASRADVQQRVELDEEDDRLTRLGQVLGDERQERDDGADAFEEDHHLRLICPDEIEDVDSVCRH